MADESEGQAAEEVEVEVMEEVAGESEEEGGGMVLIIGLVLLLVIAIVLFTGFVIPGCFCGSPCKAADGLDAAAALDDCRNAVGEKAKDLDTLDKVCKVEEKCGTAKFGEKACCSDGKAVTAATEEATADGAPTPPGDAPTAE